MNIARMVSQLCYSGKTLSEIAGYSTIQMSQVLFLRRDKWGNLVDPSEELPPGVKVDDHGMRVVPKDIRGGFTQSFRKTKINQGLTETEAQAAWEAYIDRNPQLERLISLSERRRKAREHARRQPAGA